MKRTAMVPLAVVMLLTAFVSTAWTADPPADRVVAIYFHRTERCPTCLKMGGYAEEAVKTGFAEQIKQGRVEFHHVDFQDEKNAAIAKGYRVNGPAMIVIKVAGNKAKEYKDLKDIWTKVREKPDFVKYVRDNVEAYLK